MSSSVVLVDISSPEQVMERWKCIAMPQKHRSHLFALPLHTSLNDYEHPPSLN